MTDRELGRGSYATVLEVDCMGLKYAGKKIHKYLLKQGDTSYTICRFEEECRLATQSNTPPQYCPIPGSLLSARKVSAYAGHGASSE